MTAPEIDLRSDTVTRPTPEMLAAMAHASLGDDSRDGDPTVERLEDLAALRCGKEAGLFLPSGTMANLVAILAHTGRAGEVLMEATSHTLTSELGGIGALAGLFTRPLPGHRGAPDFDALRAAVRRHRTDPARNLAQPRGRGGAAVIADGRRAQPVAAA